MQKASRPLVLIILDGWGYREESASNAIALANTPHWDSFWKKYPHTLLTVSGHAVGLPHGQMGNSEVGHLTMGAGRVIHQDLTRIDLAIEDRTFFSNPVLVEAINLAVQKKKAIHILGLLSEGGVHSHAHHIKAILALAAEHQAEKIYIHAFLDGRDTPPQSAKAVLAELIDYCEKTHCGKIISIIGRYYAMDRDKRLERTQQAYDLIVKGCASYQASDAIGALEQAYARGEKDEFVQATRIIPITDAQNLITIQEDDTVIFMNFRADRVRQLTKMLIDEAPKTHLVTLTEYDAVFKLPVAFPQEPLTNIFGKYISELGLRQLRIAETEKYAHVTFFFNGGVETPYAGEDRILIPSPRVATYDLQPAMHAPELADKLIQQIKSNQYDVIICNFANPDMVGHTGDLQATMQAIETIDTCLEKIIMTLQSIGGEAIITADHGNAEIMFDEKTGQPHTAHTNEKVPFLYIGRSVNTIESTGLLSDIAPTMLYLLGLSQPSEMTGRALVVL